MRLQHQHFKNKQISFYYFYGHYMSNTWWSILVTWWINKIIQSTGRNDNETQRTEWFVLKKLFFSFFSSVRSFIRSFVYLFVCFFGFILFWRVKYFCVGVWTYKLYWNQLDATVRYYVNTSNQLTFIPAIESYRWK